MKLKDTIKKRRKKLQSQTPLIDDFPKYRSYRIAALLVLEKGLEKIEHLCSR